MGDHDDLTRELTHPRLMTTRAEALARPSPVPRGPGVYAWYFDVAPAGVPTFGCHTGAAGRLLYVGISPRRPRVADGAPSRGNLRTRVRNHLRGNASGSTLRLSLGALLAAELGLELRRVGASERMTFTDGENILSTWLEAHARVCWVETPTPWLLESRLLDSMTLPLNLDQNARSGFAQELSAARSQQRERARSLPVVRP